MLYATVCIFSHQNAALMDVYLQILGWNLLTCIALFVRPRGGAVSLYSEEAAAAGVFPRQGQRVSTD